MKSPDITSPTPTSTLNNQSSDWSRRLANPDQLSTISVTAALNEVVQLMGNDSIGQVKSCVLVLQGQRLVSLVTERDVVRLMADQVPLTMPIAQGMSDSLSVLSVADDLSPLHIMELMRQRQIHHVPLVNEQGEPVGLVTANLLQQVLSPPHMLKLQPVRSRMTQNWITVQSTDSALAVATALAEYQVSCAAVIDSAGPEGGEALLGMIFRQDLIRFQARQQDLAKLSAQTVMQEAQFCLRPSDSLWLAYQAMQQRQLPCLLVVDDDRHPIGVLTQCSLLYALDYRENQTSFSHLWQSFWQSDKEQLALWKSHSSELERLVQVRTQQLEEQAKCDRVLTTLTQRIHESLELPAILSTTASEVRQLLQADRTLIYQFDNPDTLDSGTIIVEAVTPPWPALLGQRIRDHCFAQHWAEPYRDGRIQAIEDIETAGLSPCHVQMLAKLAIRANLVVPIVSNRQLWGLLVVSQCSHSRRWRDWEIRLLEQLVRSVAIAIRQSTFYQQLQADIETRKQYEAHLQQLNDELETKVEARTASWQQATERLKESETKFRSLVEQTNDWVWEIDAQMLFIYVNPRATDILGYATEDILNRCFTDFMAADEAVRLNTILEHGIQQQQSFTQIELTGQRADGEPVVLEISGSPVFSSDQTFQGYRGITRDITERKQTEINIRKALTREKELSELKTRFISMASHEFRTPLTTILASAETLERYRHRFSPEKQQVILKRIQSSVHYVIGLLNDVLTVGKSEAGKLTCHPIKLDLKAFCRDLIEELQLTQSDAPTAIELEFTGETSQVLADDKLLRHILINLLSNALKYSPNHSPILLKLHCTAQSTHLQVIDHGIGIPEAEQPRLFDAFHRASNVGNISGTGLGLVIAKRATEAHQGRISFASQLGIGTTFTVVLPLKLWREDHV